MTARLVALMAFVLFLCLGAFTLLLQSSREIVIREAKEALRTTSFETLDAVARASMEIRVADGSTGTPWIGPWPPRTARWWSASAHEAGVPTDLPVGPVGVAGGVETAYGLAVAAGPAPLRVIDERKEVWIKRDGSPPPTMSPAGNVLVRREAEHFAARFVPSSVESTPPGAGLDAQQRVRVLALTGNGLVRTAPAGPGGSGSSDAPAEGMQLDELYVSNSDVTGMACEKFAITLAFLPDSAVLARSERGPGAANEGTAVDLMLASDSKDSRKLVHFEVPGEFDSIFRAAQQKSLWWFVGVLAVGTVLSAGLARRFTRPIRDLDVALRRLSDGDLDVTVDVNGKHEVGRLQTAFNAMARRLAKSREIEKELHRREKLSALGRLAAGVAHDVRNPLHSIQLTLDHLGDAARPQDASPAHEFDRGVRLIRGEIERLDRLVENFLCFARADGRRTETVDLGALLADVANFVAKEAQRRGLVIAVEAETRGLVLAANPESLRSALLNLVLNGFEAMSPGGTLTLRARTEGDAVVVEVEDTGRGIAPEDQERVFEFGFTTRADGHGLGLAMVHQVVVEEHGGRVGLASSPGVGTRVRIELPARAPAQVVA